MTGQRGREQALFRSHPSRIEADCIDAGRGRAMRSFGDLQQFAGSPVIVSGGAGIGREFRSISADPGNTFWGRGRKAMSPQVSI